MTGTTAKLTPDFASFRDLERWLIAEGRLLDEPVQLVDAIANGLVSLGLPLKRLRINQRVANPLVVAWGMIWNRDTGTRAYKVQREILETSTYIGSPFQIVAETRSVVRQDLTCLDQDHHATYHDLAAEGATDFLAIPNVYGDGSVQGMSFVTDAPGGFTQAQVDQIVDLAPAIGAAFEPMAMRGSMQSLLETFIGKGPTRAVLEGAMRRGDKRDLDAVILLADMRNFTEAAERLSRKNLLDKLDRFFGAICSAVDGHGGDVLKFLGDGLLAIFPIERNDGPATACCRSISAVGEAARSLRQHEDIDYVVTLSRGEVTYGNVGSPDRLDFTVVGPAVNLASRLEHIAKKNGVRCLISAEVNHCSRVDSHSLGLFDIRGITWPQELFALDPDNIQPPTGKT
jgi:adenylate cyclase